MLMIKSLWGEINLRCQLTVLVVNKPDHLKEFRPGVARNYFIQSRNR